MRTREDALKSPEAGDRWDVCGSEYPWSKPVVVAVAEDGEVRMQYEDATSTWMTRVGFVGTMSNATFLGGAQ